MPHFGNVVRAGPVGCASRSSHTVRCVREARGDVFLRLPPLAPLASDLQHATLFCNTYLAALAGFSATRGQRTPVVSVQCQPFRCTLTMTLARYSCALG